MAGRDKPDLPAHRSLFRMILAPTVWAVHFLFVYGLSAVWCAKDWGAARTLSWSITAATVLALALIVGLAVAMWRQCLSRLLLLLLLPLLVLLLLLLLWARDWA